MPKKRPPAVDSGVIILASGSPRRRELLTHARVAFVIRAADIDETRLTGEAPAEMVVRLAVAKARVVHAGRSAVELGLAVLAADTTVDLDGRELSKPESTADAAAMLSALSGRWHLVHSGVAIVDPAGREHAFRVTTEVEFASLSRADIDDYVATGEAFDKAGAYGMQGGGAVFVTQVRGSPTNVIGLPLAETLALLRAVC